MFLAKLKEIFVAKNRDSDEEKFMLKAEISSPDDIQEIEFVQHGGVDYKAPIGSRLFGGLIGKAFKVIFGVDDRIAPDDSLEIGEIQFYAAEDGTRKAKIRLKTGGDIVLNDGSDWAVQFTEMKKQFDQFKSDHNNHVSTYNGHIHITTATVGATPTPGVISPTVSTSAPSTADMSGAKVESVRLP